VNVVNLVSWVVANWRLKLLALVLAVGLLMAVAFSENPVEARTVPVGIQYVNKPDALVLVQPPARANVSVFGLRDAVERVQSSAVGVTVDLAGAKVGPNQTFYGRPKVVGSGVTAQSDPIAVLLTIDTYERALLDIEVRLPDSPAIGVRVNNKVALCPGSRDPCKEPVSGPASILEGLRAFVRYDTAITNAGGLDSPSQPVQFEKNGKLIDLRSINTSPVISIEQPTVAVHIDSVGGTLSRSVVVYQRVVNNVPCGYQASLDVAPGSVTLYGPIDLISKYGGIALDPAVNLATLTSSETLTRNVPTGSDQVRADPASVKVNVTVTQTSSCGSTAPSPSPSPSPTR
jgi:YbbR domain-containing protein